MKDILVDQDGDLRCPKCHGKNFDHKRSLKAKVTLGVVVLPAALLAKKRMKCLNCGAYSKTGNAQLWADPKTSPSHSVTVQAAPINFTPPAGTGAVTVDIVGTTSNVPAVISAKLLIIPGLSREQREGFASMIAAGERTPVARLDAANAELLVERMAARGLTAKVSMGERA